MHLPETHYSDVAGNPTEMLFSGIVPVESATSLMFFIKGNASQKIIHQIKYHDNLSLGHIMGRRLGTELQKSGRFDDVDILVPVPLHWRRRLLRGYNQSQIICEGIVSTFPRPIEKKLLFRQRYINSQARKNRSDRQSNTLGAFKVKHPGKYAGLHILLVDDVITTGSTTRACWEALSNIPRVKISIASLALAESS